MQTSIVAHPVYTLRGVAHTYWNPDPTPARYLLIMTPTIQALIAVLHASHDGTPAAMRAIYQQHYAELLL